MPSVREAGPSASAARAPTRPAPPPAGAANAERLKAIIAEAATPEDALEPSLRWIVEAVGGAGGAICFFDQRKELLRLAAECNLSDEGCRRLRSVRRGDVAGWDMPLHGLLNRRAYLIDSAAKNRYVPPLVDGPVTVRSVVCLPLYQGNNPLGSLLIVATGARMLTERDIRDLEPSLRELVGLIEAIRLRAPTVTSTARSAATVTPIAGAPAAQPDAPRVRGAADDDAGSASAVLMEVIELRSKSQDLKARIADLEAAAAEEATRLGDLEAKLRQTKGALTASEVRERELKEQLDVAQRADLPKRLAEMEARAREQAARAADLETRLAESTATSEATIRAERARAVELETRVAGRQQALERLTAAAEELKARLATTETSLASEKARADEALQRLETASADGQQHADAERAAAREVVERLRAELAERTEAERDLRATLAGLEVKLAAAEASVEAERARADEALQRLETSSADGEQYADAERAAAREMIDRLRAELAEQREQVERLEPAAHGAESLERDLRATREREAQLRAKLAVLETEVAGLRAESAVELELVPVAPAPATPAPPTAPAAAPAARPSSTLVVIDTGGGWSRLAGVRVETPDADLAGRLEGFAGRILVNLAAPGALRGLADLRAAGSTRRFWGCLATSDAARALPLGMIEPAVRPLAPEALVELLAGYAARGTRVVTLGRDIDAFGGFRESMARQGLSVSMAWDAKQAADVIAMVRPEVAVVDLDSLREGCTIMAGLAGAQPLAHFVLLFGAKDPAPGFAHAVRDPAHASRALPLDRLVAELAKRNEGPPAERR